MTNIITNQRAFYINSFYAQYTNTNFITYTLDCEDSYIESVNKVAITQIFIPGSKMYQFDPADVFTLQEGSNFAKITLPYANYQEYVDMTDDLQRLLNDNSPNNLTYTVTLLKNQLSMKLTVTNPSSLLIKILIPEKSHLLIAYGLNETNEFIGNELNSTIISKTPIDEIFINSNCVLGFNTTSIASSLIAVFDLKNNQMQQYDILTASKPFGKTKRLTFTLSDFDGDLIDLNNKHWYFELQLFHYDENFLEKMKLFIDYITFNIMEKERKERIEAEEEERKKNEHLYDQI